MSAKLLDEFISSDKNTKFTKEQVEVFKKELLQAFVDDGASEKNFEYLIRGQKYGSVSVFMDWLMMQDDSDAEAAYEQLVKSSAYSDNINQKLPFMSALFAQCLSLGNQSGNKFKSILEDTIKRFPKLLKGKDGNISTALLSIMRKRVLDNVSTENTFIPLDEYDLPTKIKVEFVGIMNRCLNADIGKQTKKQEISRKALYEWISEDKSLGQKRETDDVKKNDNAQTVPSDDDRKQADSLTLNVQNAPNNNAQSAPDNMAAKTIGQVSMSREILLNTINQYLDHADFEKSRLLKSNGEKDSEISELRQKIEEAERKIVELNAEKEALTEEKNNLSKLYEESKQKLKDADDLIAKQRKSMELFNVQNSNKHEETLNTIASKLAGEYKDFQSTLNDPDSAEMSENYRFQIEEIFNILKKSGIDVTENK